MKQPNPENQDRSAVVKYCRKKKCLDTVNKPMICFNRFQNS